MYRYIVFVLICMLCASPYAHAAGKHEQDKDLIVLKQPTSQDPAQAAFNAADPTPPKIGWHRYASEAYVGEYYYDAASFRVNKSLGVVVVNVRIEEGSDAGMDRPAETYDGEAWIDLSKGVLYKDVSFRDIDDKTGELKTREQRQYGMNSDTEKGLLIVARRWAINHCKTNPEDATALGPIGLLEDGKTWLMYAYAPWAKYYYAEDSIAFDPETIRFVLMTRIESTDQGKGSSINKRIKSRGIDNEFKVKTAQTVVDLEKQELLFVDYYITLDDVATTPSEGIPVPKKDFSKDQKKLFELVAARAKAHLARTPADRKAYKARYPRSPFVR